MRLLSIVFAMIFSLSATAQRQMTTAQYIQTYQSIAVEQMRKYKIPASITLAQAIVESGNGGSRLAVSANNHFGIKCSNKWSGARIYHDDDRKGECFRKYRSAEESFVDHSLFLTSNSRYAALFKLKITDYRGWAHGLKAAGYATNPQYAQLLIRQIENNNLQRFDVKSTASVNSSNDGIKAKPDKYERTYGFNNGVKFVVARTGDTFSSLASQYRIGFDKLLSFNDLSMPIPLKDGTTVYLKRKKSKSSTTQSHTVQKGETLHTIAQQYGIKLKSLKSHNRKLKKQNVQVGQILKLK